MTRIAVAAVTFLVALGEVAIAQESAAGAPAFEVDRLHVAPGPGAFVDVRDDQVLREGAWHGMVLGTVLRRPIVLRDVETGEDALVPVTTRIGYQLALARGFGRYHVGLVVPLALQVGERLRGIGVSEEQLATTTLGDVRFHSRFRLHHTARFGVAADAWVSLPTGDAQNFSGEASTMLGWDMVAAWRRGWLSSAANLGVRLRTEEVSFLSPARAHGNELVTRIGVRATPPGSAVSALGELVAIIGDNDGPSPAEWRLGIVGRLTRASTLSAMAGAGLGKREVGSPASRVLVLLSVDL